jgi:hypothetical protein
VSEPTEEEVPKLTASAYREAVSPKQFWIAGEVYLNGSDGIFRVPEGTLVKRARITDKIVEKALRISDVSPYAAVTIAGPLSSMCISPSQPFYVRLSKLEPVP